MVERISYFGKSDKGIREVLKFKLSYQTRLSEEQAVMVLDNVTDKDFVAKKNLEGVSDIEIRSSSRDSSSSEGHEGNDQSEKENEADECWSNELYFLRFEGLLKGGSKRRCTPLGEISHPLPSNAILKKVHLSSSYGQKEKQYTQGSDAKHLDILRSILRPHLLTIKPLSLERRREYIEEAAPNVASQKKLLDKLANNPCEGNAWHADHIVLFTMCHRSQAALTSYSIALIKCFLTDYNQLGELKGECKLENMRTLCVACHSKVTAAQRAERCSTREKARKQLEVIMNDMKYMEETATNVKPTLRNRVQFNVFPHLPNLICTVSSLVNSVKDRFALKISGPGAFSNAREDLVDELLVKVPGSAYSGGLSVDPETEELKKSSNEEVDEVKTGRSRLPGVVYSGKSFCEDHKD
uniref:Uncharacterized protein n=1 Tax=Salix viminalis TaxID=40686 RepID=A0A6N2LX81_SALVM